MKNDDNELPESEKFSDDPEENVRLENEFLKLKMMAESGGIFGGTGTGLPPEIENQWLKNVMEFEKTYADAKPQKVAQLLGNPSFENEGNLDDEKLESAFNRLQELLKDHNINVNFIATQTDRVKYNFITGELFEHETDFVPVKGMVTNFIYEEFHPDHKNEIAEITNEFLNDFFDRKLSTDTHYINDEIIIPDGNIISKEQLISRFNSMYEVALQFKNTSFQIQDIQFEINENTENIPSGMGFSEGNIQYDMIFENGERREITGPFKIYFGREWDLWGIYFFYLVGYNLQPKERE